MEDASGGLLSELEAQLRAPDSVMEPKVLDLLRLYFNAGGKIQTAIEDLSESYVGARSRRLAAATGQPRFAICPGAIVADVEVSYHESPILSSRSHVLTWRCRVCADV